MSIIYCASDDKGYYVDHDNGTREYLSETVWRAFVMALHNAGAKEENGVTKGRISCERVILKKFDLDGNLVETIER